MAETALQGVDAATLAALHDDAMRLGARLRAAFPGSWRDRLDPAARATVTIAALLASTQLMEAMSWLLRAQSGRMSPSPAWHAGRATAAAALGPERGAVAAGIDRLYARVIATDAAARA